MAHREEGALVPPRGGRHARGHCHALLQHLALQPGALGVSETVKANYEMVFEKLFALTGISDHSFSYRILPYTSKENRKEDGLA